MDYAEKLKSSIAKNISYLQYKWMLRVFHTPLHDCVEKIHERRKDDRLVAEIESFLDGDIPDHFKRSKPIFYFSRYVATPDYETMRYINQVQHYNMPIVIGEDHTDIFTSNSSLKRNLLKLPIITGQSKNGNGIVEFKTIADFNTEQGKKLKDVKTIVGTPLTNFHANLTSQFLPKSVSVVDESQWVDRHHRGQLIKLYEDLLPILITHGVMLEYYEPDEVDFIGEVVIPAFEKTKQRFGYTPLIAPLENEFSRKIVDVNSYPAGVLEYAEELLSSKDAK